MLTILENDGLRTLHFGTPAVQGAMRVARPDDIELEYVQQMMMWLLFRDHAEHIVQLGLGAAALTKFCYQRLLASHVTAVELNPDVISTCRQQFALPPNDDRLNVLNMDALDYVNDFSRRRTIDILQVDLYDARAHAPAVSSEAFYAACANTLSRDGIMTVNLYCDWPDHGRHIRMMETAFEAVAWLPEVHDGNIVAIAFKRSPSVDFEALRERATHLHQTLGLPAHTWVDGLFAWMLGELDIPVMPEAGGLPS
ncbi:spermidine synthase [Achromobacter sp. F4_2707]|uniref:spermine/spermidine synthase domain-containing protein n=1 Tax=Achromobacter sp. F4_2707 TaxID=3114286 RepID=UPI0039C71772